MKMTITATVTIILTFFCLNGICQENNFERPDYKQIQTEIQDSTSRFYYPKLFSRLQAFDTSLNLEEYRHLYFGYVFQKEYQPYMISSYDEELLKYYNSQRKDLTTADYDKIIQLVNSSLAEFPFNLRALNFVAYIYFLRDDKEMAQKMAHRAHGITNAIMSSGNGKTCETAFHVITISHEYTILYMNDLQMQSQGFTGTCDHLTLVENVQGINELYFNVEMLFEKNRQSLGILNKGSLSDSKADNKSKKKKDKKKKKSKKHGN